MEEYIKISKLTGKRYNIFDPNIVRIFNMRQVAYYLSQDLIPLDVCVSEDKNGKKILVYLYYKNDTKEAFDCWCRGEVD